MAKKNILFILFSLLLLSCNDSGEYKIENGQVLWVFRTFSFGEHIDTLKCADAETFRPLKYCYGVDKEHAFYKNYVIKGVDVATFNPKNKYLSEDANDFYWRNDAFHVYDKSTFKVLYEFNNDAHYAKDSRYAYRMTIDSVAPPFKHADYKSFKPSLYISRGTKLQSSSYSQDCKYVYYEDKIVKGADPETFRQVDLRTGQDKHGVYYCERKTEIKDYSTIHEVSRNRLTDSVYVYDKELRRIAMFPDSL